MLRVWLVFSHYSIILPHSEETYWQRLSLPISDVKECHFLNVIQTEYDRWVLWLRSMTINKSDMWILLDRWGNASGCHWQKVTVETHFDIQRWPLYLHTHEEKTKSLPLFVLLYVKKGQKDGQRLSFSAANGQNPFSICFPRLWCLCL